MSATFAVPATEGTLHPVNTAPAPAPTPSAAAAGGSRFALAADFVIDDSGNSTFWHAKDNEGRITVWWSEGKPRTIEGTYGSKTGVVANAIASIDAQGNDQRFFDQCILQDRLQQAVKNTVPQGGIGYGRLEKVGNAWRFTELSAAEKAAVLDWLPKVTDSSGLLKDPEAEAQPF